MLFKVSKNIFFYLLCLDSNSMFFSPRILSPSTRLITVKRLIIFLKTWSTVEIKFSPTLTTKELTLCHKLCFSKPYIFGTKCCNLRYFKLCILLDQIIRVWNIKGLQHWVLKILRFKYLILFQRLNAFKENLFQELS